ncbi:DegQ family serine endoprotease [candidate division KSB1 bacterium]|nr:DegQ family serine endoprotease [candidate division KSB1 bacterium]
MINSNKLTLTVIGAIFIGIVAGLIIASNFNWTLNGFASDVPEELAQRTVVLGSDQPPLQSTGIDLEQLDNAFVQVAERVKPSVVTISSAKIIKYRRINPFNDMDLFRHFFGVPDNRRDRGNDQEEEEELRQSGLGSGVIVSADGYILTNNHVIEGADEIKVITIDDKEYSAEIVGADSKTDVAVIKIDEKNLPAVRLGDSDKVRVGQFVLAIGNPFAAELDHTVTHGIISAKGRSSFGLADYEDFIQTDAAINPGNSGGALVNLRGEMIGINTAIISRSGGNVGIGFAIPINLAQRIMEMLIDKGRVVRGYLGLLPQDVDENIAEALNLKSSNGALVAQVMNGEPADKAGVKTEDVIIKINDEPVKNATDLRLKVATFDPGSKVRLLIIRDGKEKEITVTLGERPDDIAQANETKPGNTERLGIQVENLTSANAKEAGYEGEEGVLVSGIKRNSIAYREGVRQGDLIKQINRQPVQNVQDFNKIMGDIKAGDIVFMRLKKHNDHYYVSFKMPAE